MLYPPSIYRTRRSYNQKLWKPETRRRRQFRPACQGALLGGARGNIKAARSAIRQRNKEIEEEALSELVARIGPNPRQLENEIEKLSVFPGDRKRIEFADVTAVCSQNKTARAFALGDALGDRDLPRLLKRLDEELWDVKFDKDKSEIGLLYGLIAKIRTILLLKEMIREGWVRPESRLQPILRRNWSAYQRRSLPADRKFNPLAMNPYVLYKDAATG